MVLLGVLLVLLLVVVFILRVWGSLLVIFLFSLIFKRLWLPSFYGVIHATEEAKKMGFTSLWIECDSVLLCAAFTGRTNVHWILPNRWNTCLDYWGKIKFRISHFHEGNACADKLINLGFINGEQFHWYRLPKYHFS